MSTKDYATAVLAIPNVYFEDPSFSVRDYALPQVREMLDEQFAKRQVRPKPGMRLRYRLTASGLTFSDHDGCVIKSAFHDDTTCLHVAIEVEPVREVAPMTDDRNYTEEQFLADLAAVVEEDKAARETIARAEFRGGSLDVCARLHRAYEEGRDYWWEQVKPKTMRPQSKPYAFSYFAKFLRQHSGMAPRTAYQKESAHLLVSDSATFAHAQKSPESEAQVRPLHRLIKIGYGDDVGAVWAKAVDAADGEQPTMAQVAAEVKAFLARHQAAPKRPSGPRVKPPTMQERIERHRRDAIQAVEQLIELDAYEAVRVLEAELAKARKISEGENAAIRAAIALAPSAAS